MYRFAAKYRWISAFQLLLVACSMIWSSPMVAAAPLQSLHYEQLETVLHSDDREDASHVVALGEFVAEVEVESELDEDTQRDLIQGLELGSNPIFGCTVPRHVVWTSTHQTRSAHKLGTAGVKIYILHRVLRI